MIEFDNDNAIEGVWRSVQLEGGCSNCHARNGSVARVRLDMLIIRLCPACLSALNELATSMLEDTPVGR